VVAQLVDEPPVLRYHYRESSVCAGCDCSGAAISSENPRSIGGRRNWQPKPKPAGLSYVTISTPLKPPLQTRGKALVAHATCQEEQRKKFRNYRDAVVATSIGDERAARLLLNKKSGKAKHDIPLGILSGSSPVHAAASSDSSNRLVVYSSVAPSSGLNLTSASRFWTDLDDSESESYPGCMGLYDIAIGKPEVSVSTFVLSPCSRPNLGADLRREGCLPFR
jgi:hypothetical protein